MIATAEVVAPIPVAVAIPPIPMPECAEDWTGKMCLGPDNLGYWIPPRLELVLRYNVFPREDVTVAIDAGGRTLVCWGAQELPAPWTRDDSIALPRSPNID